MKPGTPRPSVDFAPPWHRKAMTTTWSDIADLLADTRDRMAEARKHAGIVAACEALRSEFPTAVYAVIEDDWLDGGTSWLSLVSMHDGTGAKLGPQEYWDTSNSSYLAVTTYLDPQIANEYALSAHEHPLNPPADEYGRTMLVIDLRRDYAADFPTELHDAINAAKAATQEKS